ncbi:SDR family oxidoreductase [Methanosarcina sp. KYL-1]|uniref:SDR family oxidoreductase n=1 Tax=Methanosarcina sp. KYL-1 TaxID=2602068 RepID=UPI002101457E|nr:SDR family oxidoreductase [Methanosarcina sp. KYL-1]MCQ1536611.1 SDR family oxidoreductase [Methanosarcina sp. KYL-1]
MSSLNEAGAEDLGLSSVKDNDELGVLRSLDILTDRGTEYINKGLEPDARRAVTRIKGIGRAAALQGMEIGVFVSLISLGRMAEAARGQKLEDTGLSILYSFCSIGKAAAGQEMEAAVRVAAAYLGEIVNSASRQDMKREAMVAALALGNMGRDTYGHSGARTPENGGLFPTQPGVLLSPPQVKEATIFSEEFPGALGIMIEHARENNSLRYMPSLADYEFMCSNFRNFENTVIQAAHSLETIRFESDEKYLISYILMAKMDLEAFSEYEFTNEADAMEK